MLLNKTINLKILFQGTDTIRPYDQFHSPRRTGIIMPQVSRFKVWISVLKFDLSPKFGTIKDSSIGVINTAGSTEHVDHSYHEQTDHCNGMLRIWDGPLREIPTCNDLDW